MLALAAACAAPPAQAIPLAHFQEATLRVCPPPRREIDILLVVDNSASMAAEQVVLAENLRAFAQVLDRSDVRVDYRIAVTTTNVSGPGCTGGGEGSEGLMVDTSCRARADDFVVRASHESVAQDLRAVCFSHCPLNVLPMSSPWIERVGDVRNFPESSTAADILTCMGLVGISGCLYESPLEAAHRALLQALSDEGPNRGFLRESAALHVIFIGDEDDCSAGPQLAEALELAGTAGTTATSAACWQGGTRCVGGPGEYEDCTAVDRDAQGSPSSAEMAVLRPVQEYTELLSQLDVNKRSPAHPGQRVFTSAVAGVLPGGAGEVYYADAEDPQVQAAFGIGPGCTSSTSFATPAVRLQAVVDAFAATDTEADSICDLDWAHASEPWAHTLAQVQPRECPDFCAADLDPSTPWVEPNCVVTEQGPDGPTTLPRCEHLCSGQPCMDPLYAETWGIPADAQACVIWRGDLGDTPSSEDDVSAECLDSGANLSFSVRRRLVATACIEVTCEVSSNPQRDCPNM